MCSIVAKIAADPHQGTSGRWKRISGAAWVFRDQCKKVRHPSHPRLENRHDLDSGHQFTGCQPARTRSRLNSRASEERYAADSPAKRAVEIVDLWANGASESILRGIA